MASNKLFLPVRLYSVFSSASGGGNTGGVVFLENQLNTDTLQFIARDLGAPTTGFVRRLEDKNRFAVRFFSSSSEMNMCGHVTVAIFTALFDDGLISDGTYFQETSAGTVPVEVGRENGQTCVFIKQVPGKFACQGISADEISALFGIPSSLIKAVEPGSTSLNHLFIELTNDDTLAVLDTKDEELKLFSQNNSIDTIGVWAMTPSEKSTYRLRDFCHGVGDVEEAASGTTNAALATLLWRSNRLSMPAGCDIVHLYARQGQEMGRPSDIKIQITNGKAGLEVAVIGTATLRLAGNFFI